MGGGAKPLCASPSYGPVQVERLARHPRTMVPETPQFLQYAVCQRVRNQKRGAMVVLRNKQPRIVHTCNHHCIKDGVRSKQTSS